MNLNEYQLWTDTTAVYPEIGTRSHIERSYLGLGLCGEAGELCDKLKKKLRDGTYDAELVKAELGDILWYWVRLCRTPRLAPTYIAGLIPPCDGLDVSYEVALHLCRAAGVAAELISDDPLHPHIPTALAQVYLAWTAACGWLGFAPSEVLEANVTKLESRKARGKLGGSGDKR